MAQPQCQNSNTPCKQSCGCHPPQKRQGVEQSKSAKLAVLWPTTKDQCAIGTSPEKRDDTTVEQARIAPLQVQP